MASARKRDEVRHAARPEDVNPSMRAAATMAESLNMSTTGLLEALWPALAQPRP